MGFLLAFEADFLFWLLLAEASKRNGDLTIFLFILLAFSIILLVSIGNTDYYSHIIRRATPLPPSLVMEGERVWVYGKAFTETPVKAPHFDKECIWFVYKKEKGKDVSGARKFTPYFCIQDDQGEVWIDCSKAYFFHDYTEELEDRAEGYTHSLSYIPYPCEKIQAVGRVLRKKDKLWLEPEYGYLMLQVVAMERGEFLELFERGERFSRLFGLLGIFFGTTGLYYLKISPDLAQAVGVGLLVVLPLWAILTFNQIVTLWNRLECEWKGISIVLEQRYSLIPKLVTLLQDYMEYEKETLAKIIELRRQTGCQSRQEVVKMENKAQRLLKTVFARFEGYPELRSQELAQELIRQLRLVEERVAHTKVVYNEIVTEYNSYIESIPVCLLAYLLRAESEEWLDLGRMHVYERQVRKNRAALGKGKAKTKDQKP